MSKVRKYLYVCVCWECHSKSWLLKVSRKWNYRCKAEILRYYCIPEDVLCCWWWCQIIVSLVVQFLFLQIKSKHFSTKVYTLQREERKFVHYYFVCFPRCTNITHLIKIEVSTLDKKDRPHSRSRKIAKRKKGTCFFPLQQCSKL